MIKFGTGGWREIIATASAGGAAEVLAGYGFKPYVINRSSPTPRPHHLPGQGLHRRLEGIPGHLKYKKEHVIARAAGPHPRVASLALRAIHLLTIPWIFRLPNWCDLLSTGLPHQCAHWFAMTCLFFREAPSELSLTALPRGV